MKTAILIHGHHLGTNNWDEVVWGNPLQGVYGRIPTGLREALRFEADIIFFPTGGSKRDGLFEGEQARAVAQEKMLEVPEFAGWEKEKADRRHHRAVN